MKPKLEKFNSHFLQGNMDYHADMDSDNFNRWAEEAFASLPAGSVIVMVRSENQIPNTVTSV